MYETGKREPAQDDIEKLANALRVRVADLVDPETVQTLESNAGLSRYTLKLYNDVSELDPEQFIRLPVYEVEAAAGGGAEVREEVVKRELPFRKEFAQKLNISAKNGVMIYIRGDSMEPALYHGDVVIIDKNKTKIIDNKLYAIESRNEIIIKAVQSRVGGGLLLVSINKPRWSDQEVSFGDLDGGVVRIIGQVVYRSGVM